MELSRLWKVEVYTDGDKKPIVPKEAVLRFITIFKEKEVGIKKQFQEYYQKNR